MSNSEASGPRTRVTTRRAVASQDPGPSTSRKRSLSSQETDYVPQKRPRLAPNAKTHTKTRGTAKGKSSRGMTGKAKVGKGKGRARTAGVSRRSRRIVSSEESTSVSPLQANSRHCLTQIQESDLPLAPARRPEDSGSRRDITPLRGLLPVSTYRGSPRTLAEVESGSFLRGKH